MRPELLEEAPVAVASDRPGLRRDGVRERLDRVRRSTWTASDRALLDRVRAAPRRHQGHDGPLAGALGGGAEPGHPADAGSVDPTASPLIAVAARMRGSTCST